MDRTRQDTHSNGRTNGKSKNRRSRIFSCLSRVAPGVARKVSLVCLIFSFLGYVVFAIAFGVQANELDLSSNTLTNLFLPYWIAIVSGFLSFVFGISHLIASYKSTLADSWLGFLVTILYFVYAASLSAPLILTALFVFGASSFGDLEDTITGFVSVSTVLNIVGIDNDLVDTLGELVTFVYESAEDAVEAVVDLVLLLPRELDSELEPRAIAQFSGAVTSLFFLGLSLATWPFYTDKNTEEHPSQRPQQRT